MSLWGIGDIGIYDPAARCCPCRKSKHMVDDDTNLEETKQE